MYDKAADQQTEQRRKHDTDAAEQKQQNRLPDGEQSISSDIGRGAVYTRYTCEQHMDQCGAEQAEA